MFPNSDKITHGKLNPSWIVFAIVIIFVPFVLVTPPQFYGKLVPDELWFLLRILMQVAWLAPLLIIWQNGRGTWNGKYFLGGFVIGGGWMIVVQLIMTVIQAYGPYELSLINTGAGIGSYFFLAMTSGLYSLSAKSIPQALLFGLLCFIGQVVLFVLVFIKYIFIVVD